MIQQYKSLTSSRTTEQTTTSQILGCSRKSIYKVSDSREGVFYKTSIHSSLTCLVQGHVCVNDEVMLGGYTEFVSGRVALLV